MNFSLNSQRQNSKAPNIAGFFFAAFVVIFAIFYFGGNAESQTISIVHKNFTVQPAAIQVSWYNIQAAEVWVQNTSATHAIELSFDGGTNYWRIPAASTDTFRKVTRNNFLIRRATGAAGNAAVQCLIFPL